MMLLFSVVALLNFGCGIYFVREQEHGLAVLSFICAVGNAYNATLVLA